jgi:hypothetical protein
MAEHTSRDVGIATGLGAAGAGSYVGGRRLERGAKKAAAKVAANDAKNRFRNVADSYARTGKPPEGGLDLKALNQPGVRGNMARGRAAIAVMDVVDDPKKIGPVKTYLGMKAAGKTGKVGGALLGAGAVGVGTKAAYDHKKDRDFYKSADGEPTLRQIPTFGTIEKSTPISAFGVDHGDEEFSKAFPNLSAFAGAARNAASKAPKPTGMGPVTRSTDMGQKFGGQLRKINVGARKNWKPVTAGAAGGAGAIGGASYLNNRNRGY